MADNSLIIFEDNPPRQEVEAFLGGLQEERHFFHISPQRVMEAEYLLALKMDKELAGLTGIVRIWGAAFVFTVIQSAYQGRGLGRRIKGEMLERLGAPAELTDAVCRIIGHKRGAGPEERAGIRALHDAALLTALEEKIKESSPESEMPTAEIERRFLTQTARKAAIQLLDATGSREASS